MARSLSTLYADNYFRSRLEARWAVFFDCLGVKWRYEIEGFSCGDFGEYLPDFWLPDLKAIVEIKPEQPTELECEKLRTVGLFLAESRSEHWNCFIATEAIKQLDQYGVPVTFDMVHPHWDSPYWWCRCNDCGKAGLQFEGRADRLPCKHRKPTLCQLSAHGDKGRTYDDPLLKMAYNEAICARFEHGENYRRKWA